MTRGIGATRTEQADHPRTAERRWTIAQIGAREHYAAARAFARAGELRTLYTDFWCRHAHQLFSHGPAPLRAAAGRFHSDLANSHVVDFKFSLWCCGRRSGSFDRYLDVGTAFGRRVRNHMAKQRLDSSRDAFFGYNTGCLEVLEMLRSRGIRTIVDQIDPARVEEDIVLEERQRWPGWEPQGERAPGAYWERLLAEWERAEIVLVNSNWSRQALIRQGVPVEKIVVVPLAYEPTERARSIAESRVVHHRPLTVLSLGQVNLRKGIPYFLEAARLLSGSSIRFVVAGEIQISAQAVASAPSNVEIVGRVTRDQTSNLYAQADVFVLPTLSDGFAITQLEAQAHGVPVITTDHCGEVVTDGLDGFIIPVRDVEILCSRIETLDQNRALLADMQAAAVKNAAEFSVSRYVSELLCASEAARP